MSLLRPSKMDSWNIFSKRFWTFDNLFGKSKLEQAEERRQEELLAEREQQKKMKEQQALARFNKIKNSHLDDARNAVALLDESNVNEIPQALQDPITFECIETPVITPKGNVYDRRSLKECLRYRSIDPLTNTGLTLNDVKPFDEFKIVLDAFHVKKNKIADEIASKIKSASESKINELINAQQPTFLTSPLYFF